MTTHGGAAARHIALALAAGLACSDRAPYTVPEAVSARNHPFFPVTSGSHAVDCGACHTDANTFSVFGCTGCHAGKAAYDLLHGNEASYEFASPACYRCHPSPAPRRYGHAGITGSCAVCHEVGQPFAALPIPDRAHRPLNGSDCNVCHRTTGWRELAAPPGLIHDPARDVTVTALVPAWAGASIVAVTPAVQALPMQIDHADPTLDPATLADCGACHRNAAAGALSPGELHAGLERLGVGQPAACKGCHAAAAPFGFVGPMATAPERAPPSGEMRHDAVAWSDGAATAIPAVVADCGVCHASPSGALAATWATGRSGLGRAAFHASLAGAALPQPTSCLDCHANGRPAAVLASGAAALPAGVVFDHAAPDTLGDCAACHARDGSAGRFGAWTGGRWHLAGSADPASCLPCHAGERPTSAIGWRSTTYAASPFDYGTNAAGVTHGAGQDCAFCHPGPGTGAWGGTQDWVGGHFGHGPTTVAATTCSACHMTQRPDLQPGATPAGMAAALGFDHALDGTADCVGCHQATVGRGRYVSYVDPLTGELPGGDWSGGVMADPGATLVAAPNAAFTVTELTLTRAAALVTGFTARTATLLNAMSHASPAIPAAITPGSISGPDPGCWRCHTSTGGSVTSYANGRFHLALEGYRATPGAPVTPLSQPTSGCKGCHAPSLPSGIVERAGSSLRPMDHAALFTSPATIGGVTVTGVAGLDCSACHAGSGVTWADGVFHASIGTATPQDCTGCHYPLMASASADVAIGTRYTMAHRSTFVTDQRCSACHATALARSTTTPVAATLWQPGAYHASVAAQPTACLQCHPDARPISVLSSGTAALPARVTFDHGAPGALGDCATCHAAGGAWSGGRWHLAGSASPSSCLPCHEGERPLSTAGWLGTTYAASPFDYGTNAAGVTHGAGQDCAVCHAGPGTGAWGGTQNWIGGHFPHGPTTVAATTCSACHMSQRPDLQPGTSPPQVAALLGFDHELNGTGDCFGCHQATVTAGRYVSYFAAVTGALPGGDWAGGASYPGASLVWSSGASFTVTELALTRSGALATGFTARTARLRGAMSHVSAAIPAAVSPGPPSSPNLTGCWHCHTNDVGRVTSYVSGRFHLALAEYAATPGAAPTPLPQPTTGCADCHGPSTPSGIVERLGSNLQPMDHAALFASPATIGGVTVTGVAGLDCSVCHHLPGDTWADGTFHVNVQAVAPQDCTVCHYPLMASPAADVASGTRYAMAHRSAAITEQRCDVCHAAALASSAAINVAAALWRPGAYHASLVAAGLPQPSTCLDCHPSTRPVGVLSSAAATLPAGVTFDHGAPGATGECAMCHAAGAAAGGWTAWRGGRWHLAGAAGPPSCLPCHAGERPISTAGWLSATYTGSPFDYATNAAGTTHGDGQDCARCHAGPGTGAWGASQNWVGGWFDHGPASPAARSCIACHMSQRPDLQPGATAPGMAALLGFDHAVNGTGDCFGCHQVTVAAGRYVRYVNPATGALPGGDWSGGVAYPGAELVSSLASAFTVSELSLTRSGTLVTGFTPGSATLLGPMSHVSPAIPGAISPGPATGPDMAGCWRCHTSTGGMVTAYANGVFHASLTGYSATPGGAVAPLPQPTSRCGDCHTPSTPAGIVEGAGSPLRPMDHAALFTRVVTIGGVPVSGVGGLDCSLCHASSGVTWSDGVFHASVGAATPQECAACHYPLMASAAADVANGTRYVMAHRSALVADQRCDACHATALAQARATPLAAALWQPGVYHASLGAQPAACLDCHAGTPPAAPTQSTVAYTFTSGGGTAGNGRQWMSHLAPAVAGADCAACHLADAKPSGAAWSTSTPYHARVALPAACATCHGLANGNGAAPGTGNNLPSGLTDASTLTTANADPTTGIPAGTHDQIDHGDLNVTARDCAFCHAQAGPSTVAGVQGREWAQARFHASFSTAAPLVMSGTTGRCSHCHMNVKPGPAFVRHDHAAYTAASGTMDCSNCHAWPGTGTASSPNWLGGGWAPEFIVVGGFTVPDPPASPPVVQAGIPALLHPARTPSGCVTCHAAGGVGGTGARGYDHASPLIAAACGACHEAGSHLVATAWNGATAPGAGAGDTRPISLASVAASYKGNTTVENVPNHFYLDRTGAQVDCAWCHVAPVGIALATTGAAYLDGWAFTHPPELDPPADVCYQCHLQGRPPRDPPGPPP